MAAPHTFEQRLAQAWPPAEWCAVTVLAAVSGGADSVALLRALASLHVAAGGGPGRLIAVHLNHRLRGSESDGDAEFVQTLCQQIDVPLETEVVCGLASQGDGLEAEARRKRYQFFRQVANRCGARFVATAHTADDQAETILHRVVRGTGLAGLAGIPVNRTLSEMTTVIRPMLTLSKADVQSYLDALHQDYREDSSNRQLCYTRNRIRQQVVPLLTRQFNPQVAQAITRLGSLAREAQQVIDRVVEPLWDAAVVCRQDDSVELMCAPLQGQVPYVVRELLQRIWKEQRWPRQDMSEGKWRELGDVVRLPKGSSASLTLPGPVFVRRISESVVLRTAGLGTGPAEC